MRAPGMFRSALLMIQSGWRAVPRRGSAIRRDSGGGLCGHSENGAARMARFVPLRGWCVTGLRGELPGRDHRPNVWALRCSGVPDVVLRAPGLPGLEFPRG